MQLLLYDCGFPRWSTIFTLPNAIFFYYLFSDFYKKAYTPDSPKNDKNDNEIKGKPAVDHRNGYTNGNATAIEERNVTKQNGHTKNISKNSDHVKSTNGDAHKPKHEWWIILIGRINLFLMCVFFFFIFIFVYCWKITAQIKIRLDTNLPCLPDVEEGEMFSF